MSRPPWLHALALWPMHTTYGGGGRFTGNRRLVLRGVSAAHPEHPPHGLEIGQGDAPLHAATNEVEGADWSGRDREGRLIFAREGRIYRGDVELADLSALKPDPQPAPEWATRPLL